MAVAHLFTTSAFAEQKNTKSESAEPVTSTITLPDIENTAELDRLLSREVSDTFVFGQNNQNVATSIDSDTEPYAPQASDISENTIATDRTASVAKPKSTPVNDHSDQAEAVNKTPTLTKHNAWHTVFSKDSEQQETVWQHIVASNQLPLTDHERVTFYIEQYKQESLWISKILHRGAPFLAHMVATLDQRFLPVELALLPAIESGYRPTAISRDNAAGLWQIVPITAKEIGVAQNTWFDGRGDVLTSTTAAIDYLSYLNAEFDGDWELTLAAYNAGPGRIKAAIRKNAKSGLAVDYWSLDLPTETRNYVPKLTALIKLIKMSDRGGLDLPELIMEPAFESIDIGFRVSLDRAAEIADIDLNILKTLNAGLIHGVTAPQGPHHLLIPAGSGEKFQQAFSAIDRNSAFSIPNTHNVASGDTISSIALKYGLSQRELLSMNGLNDTKIRIGQNLSVTDKRKLSKSIVKYVVAIGDTLSEIAHKFSVNVHDITLSTGEALHNDVIRPGDTLNIAVSAPASG